MKVNVFKKKRRIVYAIGLAIGVLFNLSYCIAGLIFQPDLVVICSMVVLLGLLTFIVYSTIKKGNYHGIININKTGVSFTTPWKYVHIDWSEIRYITIHNHPNLTFIGFFAQGFEKRPKMENKKYSTFWRIDLSLIDETFVFVEYREGLLEEVKKYWENEIINEQKLH